MVILPQNKLPLQRKLAMHSSPSILLFGHDEVLLYSRREILDRAGFQVRMASSLKELEIIAAGYPAICW
jgi:hypothetical protein